jgi:hypothetical protein
VEKKPMCRGLKLMSFLIMPVQRVPRYRLLLQELLKQANKVDIEAGMVEQALDSIKVPSWYTKLIDTIHNIYIHSVCGATRIHNDDSSTRKEGKRNDV